MAVLLRFNPLGKDQILADVIAVPEHPVVLAHCGAMKGSGAWIPVGHIGF